MEKFRWHTSQACSRLAAADSPRPPLRLGVALAQPVFQPAVMFCVGTYGNSPCGTGAYGPDGIDAADLFQPGGMPGLDDFPEVAVTDEGGHVSLYSNGDASASAASLQYIQTDGTDVIGLGVQFVKIVDLDGDLRSDILSSNHGCKSISVLLNATP